MTNPLPLRPQTVLLVDDEPFVRDATRRILERSGFIVLTASSAEEAAEIHTRVHIDLLITDLVLPGKTGEQLGQDLRRSSPGLPVLLTSGYSCFGEDDRPTAPRTHFLAKPYTRQSLVEKIEQILSLPGRAKAAQAG